MRRFVAIVALGLLPLTLVGCSRGEVTPLLPNPPARTTSGEVAMFATGPDRPASAIAILSSSPRTGMDDATMARHVEDLQAAAQRAGADLVTEMRLLTVKKSGYIEDPLTPFPSPKQGDYEQYIMRGTAMVYDTPAVDVQPLSNDPTPAIPPIDPNA